MVRPLAACNRKNGHQAAQMSMNERRQPLYPIYERPVRETHKFEASIILAFLAPSRSTTSLTAGIAAHRFRRGLETGHAQDARRFSSTSGWYQHDWQRRSVAAPTNLPHS